MVSFTSVSTWVKTHRQFAPLTVPRPIRSMRPGPIYSDQTSERRNKTMKLTTTTQVSVDGVMQGPGGPEEDERGVFKRGGWAGPFWDDPSTEFVNQVYQRADAFLFGRRTYEL